MNYLREFFTVIFPTFAALASLREIIRISVAALPRHVLRGENFLAYLAALLPR
jgi:hypothetical protein